MCTIGQRKVTVLQNIVVIGDIILNQNLRMGALLWEYSVMMMTCI